MMKRSTCFASALLVSLAMTACTSVPIDNNSGELVTTPAVQRYFAENPEIQEIVVDDDSDIRCERQRRVGTHMVVRVCRTKTEWKQLREQTQYQAERRQINGPCGDTRGGGLSRCSEGRPGGGNGF